jgi:hypothetical protein
LVSRLLPQGGTNRIAIVNSGGIHSYIASKIYWIYRLIRKCMRQPRLIKLGRINKYEKCLSYEVVSNAIDYFLNALHLDSKNLIQFVVIKTLNISRNGSES